MITDNSEKRQKRYAAMRSIKDYGMGVFCLGVALIMFYPGLLGFTAIGNDPLFSYMFGGICVIYGAWRIYRGYKKEYFK